MQHRIRNQFFVVNLNQKKHASTKSKYSLSVIYAPMLDQLFCCKNLSDVFLATGHRSQRQMKATLQNRQQAISLKTTENWFNKGPSLGRGPRLCEASLSSWGAAAAVAGRAASRRDSPIVASRRSSGQTDAISTLVHKSMTVKCMKLGLSLSQNVCPSFQHRRHRLHQDHW